jgi:hypothetical protein
MNDRQLGSGSQASIEKMDPTLSPSRSLENMVQVAAAPPLAAPIETRSIPRSESQDFQQRQEATPLQQQGKPPMGPPQRPRREGDEDFRRVMSPVNLNGNVITNGPSSPPMRQSVRVLSPNGNEPASPVQPIKPNHFSSVLGTRSPSPRLRTLDGERSAPPPDAFYYGRSPTTPNGFANGGRPGSLSGVGDLMRELKARDTELDAAKSREAALKAIVGKAVDGGFVPDEEVDLPNGQKEDDPDTVRKLSDGLVRLKQEKATFQVS